MCQTENQVLGVIGGLGPIATAHFLELVVQMTQAETEQQHLDMIIFNTPSTPDRTAYLLGRSTQSPLPKMLQAGRALCGAGAAHIAVPCVTAHSFLPELENGLGVPVLDGVGQTAAYLKERGITRAGILATDGSIKTGLFHRELEALGITPIVPSPSGQQTVMDIIYRDIKSGKPADPAQFASVSRELADNGAQVILLGCTELSLIKRDIPIGPGYLDVMEVLAMCAIKACGKQLKPQYEDLITH